MKQTNGGGMFLFEAIDYVVAFVSKKDIQI